MKVVDIADEVFRELGEPTTLSIPAISFWLRANVGQLNNYIHTEYEINSSDLEIAIIDGTTVTEIGEEEKAILKKMYFIHFYDQKLRSHMTTMDTDTVLAVRDGDSSVTKINRNEVARSIASVKSQEYSELMRMIQSYTGTKAKPSQVAGDDTSTDDSTKYNTQFNRIT
jgi:hypothetical protein|tara:strand:- start:4564 stop:5070 length:507 start_codon:yes stop_codon:yes gene_type:complete